MGLISLLLSQKVNQLLLILSDTDMRKKIVAANWKMNMTQAESARFVESLLLDLGDIRDVEVVIVPPFTAIAKVTELLEKAEANAKH